MRQFYRELELDHEVETAAGRYQPSSRIASKGELSFPWNLLPHQQLVTEKIPGSGG